MKVYLAGPMSGLPGYNFGAFDRGAEMLRHQGHEVFSPVERDREVYGPDIDQRPEDACRRECLTADLRWIGEHAEAVALLPGWERSSGSKAELALAQALDLQIIYIKGVNPWPEGEIYDINTGVSDAGPNPECPPAEAYDYRSASERHLDELMSADFNVGSKVEVKLPGNRPAILQEREKTHGNYGDNARYSQRIKSLAEPSRKDRTHIQNESIDMIALKLARILSGQAFHKDHWDDIAGYAQLAAEACAKNT